MRIRNLSSTSFTWSSRTNRCRSFSQSPPNPWPQANNLIPHYSCNNSGSSIREEESTFQKCWYSQEKFTFTLNLTKNPTTPPPIASLTGLKFVWPKVYIIMFSGVRTDAVVHCIHIWKGGTELLIIGNVAVIGVAVVISSSSQSRHWTETKRDCQPKTTYGLT